MAWAPGPLQPMVPRLRCAQEGTTDVLSDVNWAQKRRSGLPRGHYWHRMRPSCVNCRACTCRDPLILVSTSVRWCSLLAECTWGSDGGWEASRMHLNVSHAHHFLSSKPAMSIAPASATETGSANSTNRRARVAHARRCNFVSIQRSDPTFRSMSVGITMETSTFPNPSLMKQNGPDRMVAAKEGGSRCTRIRKGERRDRGHVGDADSSR